MQRFCECCDEIGFVDLDGVLIEESEGVKSGELRKLIESKGSFEINFG